MANCILITFERKQTSASYSSCEDLELVDAPKSKGESLVPVPVKQGTMAAAGAQASHDGTVETFGNDDLALDAAYNGVMVVDLSHYGRIRGILLPLANNDLAYNFNQLLPLLQCVFDEGRVPLFILRETPSILFSIQCGMRGDSSTPL
ncbi:hypothetical protein ACLOJK_016680 [Asimina triloba]